MGHVNALCGVWMNGAAAVQSLSRVWLLATSWAAAHPASLSITNSRSSLRLTSITEKAVAPHSSTLSWKIHG